MTSFMKLAPDPPHPLYFLAGDASQRVKFILGDEADDGHESHEIFTEMEELCYGSDGEELEWKEMAR